MATAFNLSRRTIERWLKQLKDNQLIEYRGAPKTGGYYPKSQ
jgi:ATP-dependent DNA helicase RecG